MPLQMKARVIPLVDARQRSTTLPHWPTSQHEGGEATGRVRDRLGRPLYDLRISVTDRCNFRCTYCMPREQFADHGAFLPRSELLYFDEIARVASVFVSLGVRKIRLTGGEPLLRRDLERLVSDGSGEIGFISSVTQAFCGDCSRARLSADGRLVTCLFGRHGTDLRALLRHPECSDAQLGAVIRQAWRERDDRYSELRGSTLQSSTDRVALHCIGG